MKKILVLSLVLLLFTFFIGPLNSKKVKAQKENITLKTFVHYPKEPGRPDPVSNCTQTTNDQISDWGSAGWTMPVSGMKYQINLGSKPKNLSSEQTQTAIQNSFAAWHEADPDQIFIDDGTTTIKAAKFDGTNVILWKGISGNALAITYSWYNTLTGELVEADTAFNKNYKWSVADPAMGDCGGTTGTYDVRNIGTHEFGHWIGLDDLYSAADKDLTMYGYGETAELKKDSLGFGDINGANTIAP